MRYNDGIVQTIAGGGLVDIYPWMKVFPNQSLSKLKDCITVRDRLLSRKLDEHKASLSDGDPRDLLDALLKGKTDSVPSQTSSGSEETITDDHVLMTAAEAFGAGVETTSTTLLWILAYLLHHPEVQDSGALACGMRDPPPPVAIPVGPTAGAVKSGDPQEPKMPPNRVATRGHVPGNMTLFP
ncbi:steroid 17-alpha-hydroxylase/17,20 lyase-like [Perca fluviatilis]|uniref:steroid 17-alpha-hydroxylase/17,20 lyase-like n=1 Tax=Perca fluviatilis TaxID=8168 RepID=UPI001962E613|nr:steroid 17-alpha-hydroxylase/17,20 lyase-like [Perca fluviatilis]